MCRETILAPFLNVLNVVVLRPAAGNAEFLIIRLVWLTTVKSICIRKKLLLAVFEIQLEFYLKEGCNCHCHVK